MDYLSTANRDILVTEDGSFTQRYVYDENSTRISAEYGYAVGTKRGEGGENLQSDFAANDVRKVWYRTSHLGSTLFAVDENGKVISHTIYDPWGNPLTETYTDTNFSGIDNSNNYTGYTWDEVLDLYFAQNRFYDPADHRFTQEDPIKDGENWYAYCGNEPTSTIDVTGLMPVKMLRMIKNAYLLGFIPDDYIGSVVIIANIVSLSTDFLTKVKSVINLDVRNIYDMFVGVEAELKNSNASKQAIYVAFHETAQIIAAKQIMNKYGGVPELEKINMNMKEIDIALGDYAWEVKPGYTSNSAFAKSLEKYVKDYSSQKDQSEYTASWGWKIPGGKFADKTVKLFSYGNKSVKMSVRWLGLGKVGYFFQMKCGSKAYSEAYAKDVMAELLPAFKKAENINTATEIGATVIAFLAAIASPVPGDEAVVSAALGKMLTATGMA